MRKPTVFIVEDDLQTRKQISFMVNSLGYDVVGSASTGKSAIAKVRHIKPDIIIMDYQLRGDWDGIETAKHVGSLNWKTATIFITAHAANISQKDLQNIALDGFLSKPIMPEVLRHAIDIAAKRIATDLKIEHLTDLLQMVNQESTLLSRRYEDEDPLSFLGDALIKIRGYISVWIIITDENRRPIHYTFSSENKSPNKDLQRIITKKKLPEALNKQLDAKNNIVIVGDNPIGEKEDGILSKYIIIQLSTKQQLTGLMGIRIPYSMAITNEEIKILKGMGLDIGLFLYNRYLEDSTEKTNTLYKTLFDSNPVVKLILDPGNGAILEANPAACKFYDYDYDVLTSMNISQITILPEGDTGAAISDEQDFSVQHKTASGQVRQVEVYTNKVFFRGKPVIDMIIHDITDCVETEEQLEEAESHFSQVFLNLPDYCYMVSKDGYILNANKAACKTLGYKESEIIGKHILEIYTDDSKEKAKQAFKKMDNKGQLRNIELSIKTKTGKERQVLLNVDVVKSKDGEFQYALSIQRDITDRKNVERALSRSHEQFKTVMDSLDAYVYVCDMDTYELLYVNKAGKDAFGSDIKGKICWQTMQANQQGPCDFCTNEKLLTKDGRPKKPYKWEFQNTVTKQWLLIIDRAIKWHDGRTVRLEIATDITDRKQVERTLIESKKQLDAITGASFEAIFISEKGICIGQNKQAEKMFGYSEEEIIGKPGTDWIVPKDRDLVKHHMLAGHEEPYEVQALRKDGTTFPALIQGRMMEYQGRTVRFTALQDLSYIKKKEKELTELSERFALATKSAKTGVWDWHIKDNISVWDETICEMYGIAKDTRRVSYDTWKSFVHPDDLERVLDETESALKGKSDFDTLYRIILADKSLRYLRATAVVKHDKTGNPVRMIGANWDVTARLEAELALEKSEERFRNIFENMDNGYILISLDGNIQLVNPSTVKLLGYKDESELVGKDVEKELDIYPEEKKELKEILALQDKVKNYELTLKTKDGHHIFVECNIHLIRDEQGKPTAIEGVFQDITLRKEIEMSLVESEEQYKSIVNSIPDIVYSFSVNTGGVFYSSNVENILGYDRETLYQNSALWHDSIHPDHIDMVDKAIAEVKKGILYELEYKIKTADGSWKWLHDRAFQIEKIGKEIIVKGVAGDITDRVKSVEQIRKLSLVVEESPAMVAITTINGEFEYVNPKFCAVTGYSSEELIGEKPSILKSGLHEDSYYKKLWDTVLAGENWHGELLNKRKDGSLYWDMTNIAPMKDANGSITHFITVKLDITEQKKISEALIESEHSYRGLFNSTMEAIYIQDEDGVFVDVNDTAVEMYGYPREYFRGKTPEFISAPGKNDLSKIQKYIKAAFNGEPQSFEFWGLKKDGTIFPKEVQLTKGTYFGKDIIIAFARDITANKEAEEKLKASETKFRSIFETSKDTMYVSCLDGIIFDLNNAGMELFGVKKEEISQLNTKDLFVDQAVREEFIYQLQENGFVQDYEVKYTNKNGDIIHCLETAVANKHSNGEIETIHGIIRDITELVEAREATRLALEKAQQADKVKTLFLANMSHEIRTPLNAILGFTELLKDTLSDRLGFDEKEFFDIIRTSGNRLMNTVHEILDISQIEAGVMSADMIEISLRPIIEDCVAENSRSANEKDIAIDMVFNVFDAIVLADEHCIASSISHLIENAVKYTKKGGITITLKEENGGVIILISDTGIGISKAYQKSIFDIFSQESEGYTKRYQGVGLGMALTKRYLDMCDVDISIDSAKGKGTTFILKFDKVISVEHLETNNIKHFTKEEKQVSKYVGANILVVEDDLSNQNLIGFYLKKNKFSISFADSVSSAVKRLNEKPIHLVLLDLSLKGKQHGLDLADIMKKTKEWTEIPIVVLSAHAYTADKKRCLDRGCDDFITKPVKRDVLISTVQKYLDKKN